jgi:hypothetical protein
MNGSAMKWPSPVSARTDVPSSGRSVGAAPQSCFRIDRNAQRCDPSDENIDDDVSIDFRRLDIELRYERNPLQSTRILPVSAR